MGREAHARSPVDVRSVADQLPFHFADPRDPRIADQLAANREAATARGAGRRGRPATAGSIEDRLDEVAHPLLALAGRHDRSRRRRRRGDRRGGPGRRAVRPRGQRPHGLRRGERGLPRRRARLPGAAATRLRRRLVLAPGAEALDRGPAVDRAARRSAASSELRSRRKSRAGDCDELLGLVAARGAGQLAGGGVDALPWAMSIETNGAPSIRAVATTLPPSSTTTNASLKPCASASATPAAIQLLCGLEGHRATSAAAASAASSWLATRSRPRVPEAGVGEVAADDRGRAPRGSASRRRTAARGSGARRRRPAPRSGGRPTGPAAGRRRRRTRSPASR